MSVKNAPFPAPRRSLHGNPRRRHSHLRIALDFSHPSPDFVAAGIPLAIEATIASHQGSLGIFWSKPLVASIVSLAVFLLLMPVWTVVRARSSRRAL